MRQVATELGLLAAEVIMRAGDYRCHNAATWFDAVNKELNAFISYVWKKT